jgi:hypothetical protein
MAEAQSATVYFLLVFGYISQSTLDYGTTLRTVDERKACLRITQDDCACCVDEPWNHTGCSRVVPQIYQFLLIASADE